MRHPLRIHSLIGLCPLWCALGAGAQPVPPQMHSTPLALTSSFESLRLGHGERVGLLGGGVLFEPTDNWFIGPVIYGAATGSRGGFFVGGADLERHWALDKHDTLVAGAFVGGGGGGAAAVGGGLMLKLSAALMHDFGPLQAGLSASRVDFPNGHIRSSQLGVLLSWSSSYNYYDVMWSGERVKNALRSGLGFDRMALTITRAHLSAASQTRNAKLDAVGVRADRWITPHWYGGVEAAGAAHGNADGYAEVLGTVGYEHPLDFVGLRAVSVGARTALGLGGGGAVKTGGGVIGKAAATLTFNLTPDYYVGFEGGAVRSAGGHDHARYVQLQWGMTLDHPDPLSGRIAQATIERNEWLIGNEHVFRAARKNGTKPSLDALALTLNHYVTPHLYFSGQAHSAFHGGAGAYSVGLVGVGYNIDTESSRWSGGIEVLGGAAGGGGVSTQGGAIAQALAWAGVPMGRHSQIRLGVGRVKSLRGGLDSPVLELEWSQAFGLAEN